MTLENYLNSTAAKTLLERLDHFSKIFLEKPYLNNPNGEGPDSAIDTAPLFRFDGFDCVTYVNTVIALAHATSENTFIQTLLKINYYDSNPRYENRFHFMELDWNPQNTKNGFIRDITVSFSRQVVYAIGDIDKPNWFLHKKMPKFAKKFSIQPARIGYLPISLLLEDCSIFDAFPPISVIEIVRPNWPLREKIGTDIHISHVGFALNDPQKKGVILRHASSEQKKIVEIPLQTYLQACKKNSTIQGIAVFTLL
ncbi:MAG: hypothetical protein A3E84_03070 [Gammaproteobacteria bacterium RIFCSPHIGHO2_12_FULL_42_13]|nr:MAG: hypothetical protein A3E84_03070 [Gammaproteobacteria bacterium RIFCSPHIGHO2_12_FULL_42_13]